MTKDILRALDVEKSYLEHKLNGDNSIVLYDEIIKCGFDNLEEYFDTKRKYEFSKLNFSIKDVQPDDCLSEGWRMLKEKDVGIFFVEVDDVVVYSYKTKSYNKEYCLQHNITVYELPTGGGTIVANKGDLQFCLCIPDNLHIDNYFILDNLTNILSKYMDYVEIVDNDILVQGKKVCGMTFLRHNGMIIYLAHFSFSDNSELINSICHIDGRPKKVPSCMTNLNKDTLKAEVVKWLIST